MLDWNWKKSMQTITPRRTRLHNTLSGRNVSFMFHQVCADHVMVIDRPKVGMKSCTKRVRWMEIFKSLDGSDFFIS